MCNVFGMYGHAAGYHSCCMINITDAFMIPYWVVRDRSVVFVICVSLLLTYNGHNCHICYLFILVSFVLFSFGQTVTGDTKIVNLMTLTSDFG